MKSIWIQTWADYPRRIMGIFLRFDIILNKYFQGLKY